jgi:hypothetical protein
VPSNVPACILLGGFASGFVNVVAQVMPPFTSFNPDV